MITLEETGSRMYGSDKFTGGRYIYISLASILYHMIQKYNRYKVLQAFFDFPRHNFQLRELTRKTGITQPSMILHLKELINEGLVTRVEEGIYPSYIANRENSFFKLLKKQNIVLKIVNTGLLDYLYDSFLPNVILLFGSAVRGEDTEESDIDIFIQSKEGKIDLRKYEKIMGRKISLHFNKDLSKLSREFKNNIVNGQVLKGYLEVFDGSD